MLGSDAQKPIEALVELRILPIQVLLRLPVQRCPGAAPKMGSDVLGRLGLAGGVGVVRSLKLSVEHEEPRENHAPLGRIGVGASYRSRTALRPTLQRRHRRYSR